MGINWIDHSFSGLKDAEITAQKHHAVAHDQDNFYLCPVFHRSRHRWFKRWPSSMLAANYSGHVLEAGLDEAGRGCLAGPVMAAAVILPPDYHHAFLTDSKLLTRRQRELLRPEICREAVAWAVAEASVAEIDQLNILRASFLAMHRAVAGLPVTPTYLIVDGNLFTPYAVLPHACLVRGDSRYFSIAAASVLAKTFRDDKMAALAIEFPGYGWEQNAGYPTEKHRQAIRARGVTPCHRLSFRLLPPPGDTSVP